MFKVIGGAIVFGMALYGLVKYLERPMMKVVIHSEPFRERTSVASESASGDAAAATGDSLEST
jgi:hypothetical protein